MSSKNTENIWDNIQVDVSAEFDNVKISLGELKQISEGLVIEMGSIYENKVFLKVENKVIADGELVIVNDKYGVKINHITSESGKPAENQEEEYSEETPDNNLEEEDEAIPEEPQQTEEISDEENQNSEEFDYKDFDVDDENI